MLNIHGDYFGLETLSYFQAGITFLHGEELTGGTVQYYDPEDERVRFTDVESVALLGKALNYHDGVFTLTEYDDELLYQLLDASDTMDVYDNWKEAVYGNAQKTHRRCIGNAQ